ncbi:rho GTPase-activating protein gacV-like [Mercenaria mercenaria]|uniref:rho GTPase-activating protein gacV-like n=1 Tax=Mercenaria mercenaria TaxID=6596 RepID=UPI00234FA5C5|nr:rho GTPase-activating protein gacV-like [Mercenaria mercenaria]
MSEKATEAESHGAEVDLPPKQAMETDAPPPYNPPAQTGPDAQFQMFMNPMFAELESRVKEHEKILDKINEDMKREQEMERKAKEQAHLPGPLKGSGQELSDVMKKVEEMIVYEIDEDEEQEQENKEEEKPFSFMDTWLEARRKKALGQEPDEEEKQEVEPQKPQKDRK